jgi:hypothetical protein
VDDENATDKQDDRSGHRAPLLAQQMYYRNFQEPPIEFFPSCVRVAEGLTENLVILEKASAIAKSPKSPVKMVLGLLV